MQLVFNKIKFNNFLCFSNEELILNGMGSVLVSGVNNNKLDNAMSNGSGKSSIFNGICYALTGETLQGLTSNVENIYTNPNDCWVELDFNVDNTNFIVRRIRTPKADLKIYINGVDRSGKGIRESSKLLEEYLPDLNSQLVGSIIILGQGLPHRFTNNKPSHRKELLENLTKSDFMIQSIRDKLDIRQTELKNSQRIQEDKLIENKTQSEIYQKQLKTLSKELQECDSYNSEYSLDDRLVYLDDKFLKIENSIKLLDDEINSHNNLLENLNNERTKVLSNNSSDKQKLTSEIDGLILDVNNKVIELNVNKNSLEKEIKRLKSITDICPTCGQKIPGAHKVNTDEQEESLNNLLMEIKEFSNKLDRLKGDRLSIINEYDNKINKELEINNNKVLEEKSEISNLTSQKSELLFKKEKTITEQLKVKGMKENYNKLSDNIKTTNKLLEKLSGEKDILDSNISDINARLSVIQNLITLAKREFRGVLLQNVIEYINKKVKQYSLEVFGTELLSFTLDENYIDISYCDKPYENLSGGEKQKVDIIIQLALRELLSNQLNIHTNILCLDEIFDNLDAIGCQKILNLISKLNDIESIFIITHHKDTLEISYDTEVVVEKDDTGVSSIHIV